ncbi:hypothetical protein V8F06_001107 [Rhypophila decipiens]
MPEPRMQLEDWLDDLCVRFIINLPTEDLSSVARICFQVEEAQWFYEDFIRPLDPTLPSMSLRSFCLRIFQHCPLLASFSVENHMRAFEEFLQYKTRIPVRGAILLNEAMDSTVLVKGWKKSANWSFPRGKINKDEDDLDCAIREVEEETGFNIKEAGLVPKDDEVKYIEISMRDQQIRLYVFRNIPMDTVFQPKTRKEISAIEWYKLSDLPAFRKKGNRLEDAAAATNANKFYMVAPFLVPLKKWVVQQKKKDAARGAHLPVHLPIEEVLTEDDIGSQTDTQPQPRARDSIPAIETLEGATSELKRLLKVQPPTQGVQLGSWATPSPDKGEALMAMLRKASANPPHLQQPQPFQDQIPHTPLDHIYTNPPEPNTPHFHHAAHRLPTHNTQPPPNYPYAAGRAHGTQMQQQQQQQHFNYPASYLQGQPPQGRVPSYSPGMNPMYQHQQLRKEPILLHPQPLPPQVQQSILTRGILPTPGLPETGAQGGLQAHQASLLQAFVTPKPVPLSVQQQGGNLAHEMTSQKQSLLNAFKTESRVNNDSGGLSRNDGMRQSANQTASQAQGDPHGWANAAALQATNPAARYLPQNASVPTQQQASNVGPHGVASTLPQASVSGNRPGQATDQQRTSLLDMFKKTAPISPPSGTSTAVPSQPMENPIFARNHNNTRGGSAADNNTDMPAQKNPEVNLPYRPVQILARPKQGESVPHPGSESPAQHGTKQHASLPSPKVQSSLLADSLRESFSSNQQSPRLYQPPPSSGSPYGSFAQPQGSPLGTSPSTQQTRRQDANPEQRQRLLSLFGKSIQQDHQNSSPAEFEDKVAGKMKETVGFDQMRSGTPRSRVASLASSSVTVGGGVGGVAMEKAPSLGSGSKSSSRRGSQTPISPANRDFLLNFLQNVSSTGR